MFTFGILLLIELFWFNLLSKEKLTLADRVGALWLLILLCMEVRSGQNETRFSVCLLNYLCWLFILSYYIYILLPFVAPFFRYLP